MASSGYAGQRRPRGFLLMPFASDLDWLHRFVVDVGAEAGVMINRADDISKPGAIVDQILESIDEADVVVAVATHQNANVFYELGYAERDHDAILLSESPHDLPFDIKGRRTIFYGDGYPGTNRAVLSEQLKGAIRAVLDDRAGPGPKPAPAAFNAFRWAPRLFHTWRDDSDRLRLDVRVASFADSTLAESVDTQVRERLRTVLSGSTWSELLATRFGNPDGQARLTWRDGGGPNDRFTATIVYRHHHAGQAQARAIFMLPRTPGFALDPPGAGLLLDARIFVDALPGAATGGIDLTGVYWLVDAMLQTCHAWWDDPRWVAPQLAGSSLLPVGLLLSAGAGSHSRRLVDTLDVELELFPDADAGMADYAFTSTAYPDDLADPGARRDVITAGLYQLLADLQFREPERAVDPLPE